MSLRGQVRLKRKGKYLAIRESLRTFIQGSFSRKVMKQTLAGKGRTGSEAVEILNVDYFFQGLPRWLSGKESACQCRQHRRPGFNPWVRMIPWRRKWKPTPVFLPRKSQGQRSLEGYSPGGPEESDTTERLGTYHVPGPGAILLLLLHMLAWRIPRTEATVHGVARSWT